MKKIAGNECALLCQQLSMMISSGLSAEDGLGVVANDQPDAGLHDALLKIKNEMELGETLADSLERTEAFDAYMIRMVRIGDQVVMGGDDRYVALCRKHYNQGDLGPGLKEPVTADTGGLDLF